MHDAQTDQPADDFFVTGGTLRPDARCYVERAADRELFARIRAGEYCYVLTSRQMGKSSLMIRVASRLRREGCNIITLDLTAVGQNVTPEQWYDGLMVAAGRQLRCEDELEAFWRAQSNLGPVQRFFATLRDTVMTRHPGQWVIFVDEIDVVRGLPFSTDEFFGAIRECCNRRTEDAEFERLTFCLLGVATPSELIRDTRTSPFNVGRRIELNDFTPTEAAAFAPCLAAAPTVAHELLARILFWTHGHPYLTQRFCRALVERGLSDRSAAPSVGNPVQAVDTLVETLFFASRAREQDDNLLFVRERMLRSRLDLGELLQLYERIWSGERVKDDETSDGINELRLAGIVRASAGNLEVRNRIYQRVFDREWIEAIRPAAELERPDGTRVRLGPSCTLGRSSKNNVPLQEECISRRHALIHAQQQGEFWLVDMGSSNGTYVNGTRVGRPTRLKDGDELQIGSFRLIFRQSRGAALDEGSRLTAAGTTQDVQTVRRWLLVLVCSPCPGASGEDEIAARGQWLAACQQAVEGNGGKIIRFLEAGLLAWWNATDGASAEVLGTLDALEALRSRTPVSFRAVLHFGPLFVSCSPNGQEHVFGKEVDFILALGLLALTRREPWLTSEAAARALEPKRVLAEAGKISIPGFHGENRVFRQQDPKPQ